jgi:hypothetical protein
MAPLDRFRAMSGACHLLTTGELRDVDQLKTSLLPTVELCSVPFQWEGLDGNEGAAHLKI